MATKKKTTKKETTKKKGKRGPLTVKSPRKRSTTAAEPKAVDPSVLERFEAGTEEAVAPKAIGRPKKKNPVKGRGVRTAFWLDPEVAKAVKVAAMQRDTAPSEWLEDVLRSHLGM